MKKYFITPEMDEIGGAYWEVRKRIFFVFSCLVANYQHKTLAAKLSIRLNREYARQKQ